MSVERVTRAAPVVAAAAGSAAAVAAARSPTPEPPVGDITTGTLTAGAQEGNGAVSITYEPTPGTCVSPMTPPAPVAAGPRFTG